MATPTSARRGVGGWLSAAYVAVTARVSLGLLPQSYDFKPIKVQYLVRWAGMLYLCAVITKTVRHSSHLRLLRCLLPVMCGVVALTALASALTLRDHEQKFHYFFDRIHENRALYDSYNDSVLQPMGRDQWIRLFDRRATAFKRIYNDNVALYYEMSNYLRGHAESNLRYEAFYRVFLDNNQRGAGEPFARFAITRHLLQHFYDLGRQGRPDTPSTVYLQLYACLQDYNISRLDIPEAVDEAWNYNCQAECYTHDVNRSSSKAVRNMRINALNNMCAPQWLTSHKLDYAHYEQWLEQLRAAASDSAMIAGVNPATMQAARKRLNRSRWNTIRNLYLVDSASVPRQVADSAIQQQLQYYQEHAERLAVTDYMRYLMLRTEVGLCSYEKAWEEGLKRYTATKKGAVIDYAHLHALYPAINDLIYFNDKAPSFTPEQKHANALWLRDQAISLFHNKTDAVRDHSFMLALGYFVTYQRLLKYLTPREKVELVHGLMMCTQICTYAHMCNVANLTDILMDGVMRYRPELIPQGVELPCAPRQYAHYAALLHDWGKLRMAPVIANDFRRLNDNEIELIRTHPRRGHELLSIDSAFMPYREVALGHHRWYNGEGGYPADFDITASPVRFYIDLVCICDALEAGTDPIGRNYFLKKPFVQMIYEMSQQRGTRYNPDLIDLIRDHEDVYEALRQASDNDRHSVYYGIYNMLHPDEQPQQP